MKVSVSVVLLTTLAFPSIAAAQVHIDGFALQLFDPSYAGDRFLAVPTAGLHGNGLFEAKLTLDYAHNPLRVVDDSTGDVLRGGVIVRHQLYMHADFAYTLADRVKLAVGLPFAAVQIGDTSPFANDVKSARLADMRVGARVDLLRSADAPIAVAAQADLWLPTGSKANFASDGTFRVSPRVIASGLLQERFVYSASLGANIRPNHSVGIRDIGSAMTYSGGVAMLLLDQRLDIGPELYGNTDFSQRRSPIEAILGAHFCATSSLVVGAGAGTGFTKAPGSPTFRGLATIGYEPGRCPRPPKDSDNDGVVDASDACPTVAGVTSDDPAKNGCPPAAAPLDQDNDGIADASDACPTIASVTSDKPEKNGCPLPPPDKDNDGVADADDACPGVAGIASKDTAKNGCPPPPADRDDDGIVDAADACPDKPGVKSDDPQKNGCPAIAVLTSTEITISEQILFKSASEDIDPASEQILRAVAAILTEHPELTKITVEGHTDSRGLHANNTILSTRRAQAVRNWLVKVGIAATRLDSKGFGSDVPIDSNDSEEGRQKNRRVVFRIAPPGSDKSAPK